MGAARRKKETMNQENFTKGWAMLLTLPNSERVTPASQDIYWEMLKDIPDAIWARGVKDCLREKTFFPTIHDLGVACFGERKEEWVDKCDPYRERQNYREKVSAISWQQNMHTELKRLGLPVPEKLKLEGPVDPDADRKENARLRQALDENKKLRADMKDLLDQRWTLLQKIAELEGRDKPQETPQPKPSFEERRALLKAQAAKLLAAG